jgi:hypothetical protein
MTQCTVRVIMNGVTGRMGYRQHLVRALLAIRDWLNGVAIQTDQGREAGM